MSDAISAISAVSAVSSVQSVQAASASMSVQTSSAVPGPAGSAEVASFQSYMAPSGGGSVGELGGKLMSAGADLSRTYAERLGAARELASMDAADLGVSDMVHMRAVLQMQITLNEVSLAVQSTAQLANSVKDSFNGLYKMQG